MLNLFGPETTLLTITDVIRFYITQAIEKKVFFGHGFDSAYDEALSLVLRTLHLPLDIDSLFLQAKLSVPERNKLAKLLRKRLVKKIPIAYLINEAWFAGLQFYVDERVIIPRSPIAELIEKQFFPWIEYNKVNKILDLCTGSGCIAIACAYAFENAEIVASDISKDALAVAAINRRNHNLEQRLQLVESNCWERLKQVSYDIIIANPPYVSKLEMQDLPAEYYHEPLLALQSEDEGLSIVVEILKHAKNYLAKDGILIIEVGNTQAALEHYYPEIDFIWLEFERGGTGVLLLTYEQVCSIFL